MNYQLVYAAISPANLATVIDSQWRCLGVDFPGQSHCYLKRDYAYAAQIARVWHAARYSAGYVVQLRIRENFLLRFPLQTIAYEEHLEYRIPVHELKALSRYLVGRIRVHRAFHSPLRSLSLCGEVRQHLAL